MMVVSVFASIAGDQQTFRERLNLHPPILQALLVPY